MSNQDKLTYQGPEKEFKPVVANNTASITSGDFFPTFYKEGYFDLNYLIETLDSFISETNAIFSECERILADYSLIVETSNTDLVAAHKQAYPGYDIPEYITFDEYKFYINNTASNATLFVIDEYEKSLRNVSGTNALDLSRLALFINNESKRIKEFIDGYVGEVDDTAEFRIIENFQDWTEDTKALVKQLRQALEGKLSPPAPRSELDQVPQEKAVELQAFFQVKLNVNIKNIKDLFSQLVKNWESVSTDFYKKHLGPSLQFQLKVSRNLVDAFPVGIYPTLSQEMLGVSAIESNFSVILADQIKRNQIFYKHCQDIFLNLSQKDYYIQVINILAAKGKYPKQLFTHKSLADQADTIINSTDPLDKYTTIDNPVDNLVPTHSDLADSDADDAHPQYMLKSGGTFTGDVLFEGDVTIDGMILREHRHTGEDGSLKIRGSDIDYNSITELNIDNTNASTSVPENVSIVTQNASYIPPGITKVAVKVSFDVETSDNIVGYEFEITKI